MSDVSKNAIWESDLSAYVDRETDRLLQVIRDLVRIPSENTPPSGAEAGCQAYVTEFLKALALDPDVYSPDDVPGIRQHPLYFGGRSYANRPNVAVRRRGVGGGRSLLLSGHIDTVPRGSQLWTQNPFAAGIDGNRLYGRGSNDMKGGIGTNLFVLEALARLDLRLAGDLLFETVVDEEFGGSNGTLAGRLKGYLADAAVISEPTSLRVCPAQRGGRTAHIVLRGAGGVLTGGMFPTGITEELSYFLAKVREFARQRRQLVKVHELYSDHVDPVPVSITKVFTGPWGTQEPITVPDECRIEMYWQTMPGETQRDVEDEFASWIGRAVTESNGLLKQKPEISFPMRWLPGSATSARHSVVTGMADSAASVLGHRPAVTGIEGPCDLYVFQQGFDIPAVLWGAKGGNAHGPDEYLEIDSVVKAAKALLLFVCRWCGVTRN